MRRRRFLGLAAGAAAGAVAVGVPPLAWSAVDGQAFRPALASLLTDAEVRRVGRTYLMDHPAEANVDALRRTVLGGDAAGEGDDAPARSDFENGRTVVVDGWVLAQTEARQCALYALITS